MTHTFVRVPPSKRPVQARAVPAPVEQARRSPGRPLEPTLRAEMEWRFRHDFSRVRIHADSSANASAAALQARAYTLGPHIAFASGAYDPSSESGRRLVAHELVHVVQQGLPEGSGRPVDAEREAAQLGDAAAAGRRAAPVLATPVQIARQPVPGVAEREREVEAIEVEGHAYVLYQTEVRTRGSSSWLANNPGNMDYTPDTVEWGAYEGKKLKWGDHRFAIFPDLRTGLRAVHRFLRKYQGRRDITLMMSLFAPSGDIGNDPQRYARQVATIVGIPVGTLVKDMSDEQLWLFAGAIMFVEGWREGTTYRRGDPTLPEGARR
jgi:hypothetical protein